MPLKVVVAGGSGAGKTTLVCALSETAPLQTEEAPAAAPTTVPMDSGRITVDDALVLYLFGTPRQERFWFMWDELARGCVGAVVLVDLHRIEECFPAVDYCENRRLPFVVALNLFPGTESFPVEIVRDALALAPDVPIVRMDARRGDSCLLILITLVEHALERTAVRH